MSLKSLAIALVGVVAVSPALATERNDPARGPALSLPQGETSRSLSTRAAAANVGDVRFALHFDFERGVTRQKGIASVTNPQTGLYCIRPMRLTAAAMNRLVPSVTVDYSASTPEVMLAYYRSAPGACRSNEFGVYTYSLQGSSFAPSDNVGFTMVAD